MGIVNTDTDLRSPGRRIPYTISKNDFPTGRPPRQVIENAIVQWNLQTLPPLVPRSNGETTSTSRRPRST